MKNKKFHVVTITPPNYPHSEAFSELAEMLTYGLQALGCKVSASTAILLSDDEIINIILGAHLITHSDVDTLPENCIIFNTEQISEESLWLETPLLDLIRQHETWDYSHRNIELLAKRGITANIHYVPLGYAPQLSRIAVADEQDIDVLFYGALNERRTHIIDTLRARGLNVHVAFNCYGRQRDTLIARAKVILNVHFYETKIFEIVRVFYLLANRKAVVSEAGPDTVIDDIYRNAVAGGTYEELVDLCAALVADNNQRHALEQRGFEIISSVQAENCLRPVVKKRRVKRQVNKKVQPPVWPRQINLGSGKSFSPSHLNIDINSYWKPDVVVDLSQPGALDKKLESERFGLVRLMPGHFEKIEAYDVLEHVPDLMTFMTHCLLLLRDGGEFVIKVPYDLSHGAWQDPTHVRAFNERSWLYYTDWFWYMGWTESRFDQTSLVYDLSPLGQKLHAENNALETILLQPRAIDAMTVVLRKRPVTADEKAVIDNYLQRPTFR